MYKICKVEGGELSETAASSYPDDTSFREITNICNSKSKKISYLFLFGDSRLTWELSLVEQNTFLKATIIINFPHHNTEATATNS